MCGMYPGIVLTPTRALVEPGSDGLYEG